MSTHVDIPLNALRLSDNNARRDPGDIGSLAHSIKTIGLVSALGVTKNGHGWLVEAGGRRLAALQKLASDGHIAPDFPVPCMVFDSPSLARSLAENRERLEMDPVQQFQAFARLIGQGRTVVEVAEAFTVTPQFVRQRVKLAELCEEVITAHRQGRCTLEQMAALTFGTHEQQRAIVADRTVPGAYELRARLRGRLVKSSDFRVKLIGLPAYIAAGGRLAEDLFESTAELLDEAILDKLVDDAVAAKTVELEREYAFVVFSDAHHMPKEFAYVPTEFAPTANQKLKLDELEVHLDSERRCLNRDAQGYVVLSDDPQLQAFEKATLDRINQLTAKLRTLNNACEKRSTTAPVGVLLSLEFDGLRTREVCRSADLAALQKNAPDAPQAPAEPKGREDLTRRCAEEIAQYRQAGLARLVADSTQLALALVVQSWDRSIFGLCGQNELYTPWLSPWNGSSKRCPTDQPDLPSSTLSALHLDKVIREGAASAAARRKPYAAGAQIPLTWYIEQPKLELLAILSQCVARALCDPDSGQNALSHNISEKSREVIGHLVDATEFDLADVWQPSPEWLKSYGKAKTIAALASIGVEHIGGLSLTDLEQEKAAKVYELAAPELQHHRWVPEFGQAWALRGEV